MIKSYLVFLILFFFPAITFGQERSVSVINEHGEPVSFVYASFKISSIELMTDAFGVLRFNEEKINKNDTLVFNSIFYEQKQIPLSELLKTAKIELHSLVMNVDDVTVYTEAKTQQLVKNLSDFFLEKLFTRLCFENDLHENDRM